MDKSPIYLQLIADAPIPLFPRMQTCRAVIISEAEASAEWQNKVGDKLIAAGCRFMMAWGKQASAWDDAVDWALLAAHDFGKIAPQDRTYTTWHDNESLDEVFAFCKHSVEHPWGRIDEVLLLHIGAKDKSSEMLRRYQMAGVGDEG
jgi:hypothetical protein